MKPLILSLALCATLAAQPTVQLRSGLPNTIFIVDMSANGTPLVLTTKHRWVNDAPNTLVAGDEVWVQNVCIATGPSAVANGLLKVAAPITTTSFALTDLSGNPLTSDGTWTACNAVAYAGKTAAVTLTASPRTFFDGPAGVRMRELALNSTNGLTSLTVAANVATVVTSYNHGYSSGYQVGIANSGNTNLNDTQHPYPIVKDSGTQFHFTTAGVPNGTYTTGTVISAWAWVGNPNWDKLVAIGNANPEYSATMYLVDPGNTTARDTASDYLKTFEQQSPWPGAFPCDESVDFCAYGGEVDYGSQFAFGLAYMVEVMLPYIQSSWTSQEKADLIGKVWNQVPDGCTIQSPVQTTGTVTTSGTSVTGVGTSFLSEYQVGDLFWPAAYNFDPDNGPRPNVVSIADNTHMVLNVAPSALSGVSAWRVKAWRNVSNGCGLFFITNHHPGEPVTNWIQYLPVNGDHTAGALSGRAGANTEATKSIGAIALSLVFAHLDARAIEKLQAHWAYDRDMGVMYDSNMFTGPNPSGVNYGYGRVGPYASWLLYMMGNATGNYEDYNPSGPGIRRVMDQLMYTTYPDGDVTSDTCYTNTKLDPGGVAAAICPAEFSSNAGGSFFGSTSDQAMSGRDTIIGSAAMYMARSSSDYAYFKDWMKNLYQYSQGKNNYVLPFLFQDPNIPSADYTTQPKAFLFYDTNYASCDALHGTGPYTGQCQADLQLGQWTSLTGWGTTDTMVSVYAGDYGHAVGPFVWDGMDGHAATDVGEYHIRKAGGAGQFVGGTDNWTGGGYRDLQNPSIYGALPTIGANNDNYSGQVTGAFNNIQIPRWAGANPTGPANGKFSCGTIDMSGFWDPAIGVTAAQMDLCHLKKPSSEEIIIEHTTLATSVPGVLIKGLFYSQIGRTNEGNTGCPGDATCASLNSGKTILVSGVTGGNLVSKWLDPSGGNMRVYVETGTLNGVTSQPGGYPSGNGYAFRVRTCATNDGGVTCDTAATSLDYMIVHKVTASTGDTSLTASLLAPDANWTGVQTTDKVALFARGGVTHNSMAAITTTHSGTAQYLITGLTAGSYTITVGGVGVNGENCTSGTCVVAAGDTTAEFESTAGILSINGAAPPSPGGSLILGTVKVLGGTIIH